MSVTIYEVAANNGEYKFKPEVQDLAKELVQAEALLGQAAEKIAGLVFRNQTKQNIPAETIVGILSPMASYQEEIDNINHGILAAIVSRREAYVNPPPSEAMEAIVTVGQPQEKE